jgi:tetratricopeptide (TPR) repeat protein
MWRVVARSGLTTALVAVGDVANARLVADEALAIAHEFCGHGELARAMHAVGYAAVAAGDGPTAVRVLDEALARVRSAPAKTSEEAVMSSLADAYQLTGDLDRAEAIAREAIAIAIERGNDNFELMAVVTLARTLLAAPAVSLAAVRRLLERAEHIVDTNSMGLYRDDVDAIAAAVRTLSVGAIHADPVDSRAAS